MTEAGAAAARKAEVLARARALLAAPDPPARPALDPGELEEQRRHEAARLEEARAARQAREELARWEREWSGEAAAERRDADAGRLAQTRRLVRSEVAGAFGELGELTAEVVERARERLAAEVERLDRRLVSLEVELRRLARSEGARCGAAMLE